MVKSLSWHLWKVIRLNERISEKMSKLLKELKSLSNTNSYKKGKNYYEEDKIEINSIKLDGKKIEVKGISIGSHENLYDVKLIMNQETGKCMESKCNCPAFNEYQGICKHIVAIGMKFDEIDKTNNFIGSQDKFDYIFNRNEDSFLEDFIDHDEIPYEDFLEFLEEKEAKWKIERENRQNVVLQNGLNRLRLNMETIEKALPSSEEETEKRKLILEIVIEEGYHYYYSHMNLYLRLKVGEAKTNYIKNIPHFITSVMLGIPYEINSKLTYSPKYYYFDEKDMEILKIVKELWEYNNEIRGNENIKELNLTNISINKLLNTLEGKSITYLSGKNLVSFSSEPIFARENGKIELRNILFISEDFYYFSNNMFPKIYKIREEEKQIMQLLEYPSSLLIENLSQEESDRLERILESRDIPIAEYTKKRGMIEIYIEKSRLKNKLEINMGYSSKCIFENGKYFVPKENKKILSEIENIITKMASNSTYKTGQQEFQMNYDDFIDFSQIIDEKYSDNVILHIDSNVKKIRNINVNFNIFQSGNNLLDFTFNVEGIEKDDYEGILEGIRKEQKFITLSSGELVKIANKKSEELLGVVDIIQELEIGKNNRISKLKALQLAQISTNLKKDLRKIEEFKELFKKIKERENEEPENLKVELFPYQKIGFNWLKNMYDLGLGGIMADDMGLGKTLQMIALINLLKQRNEKLKALIVVPTSLLHNWREEFNRFSEISPILVEGLPKEREKIVLENESGVFITTYHTLRNDIKSYKEKEFDIAVLDEAQNIKNITAQVKKAVTAINSKVNFALTGTPVENNILELWSIFDFIQSGYLGSVNKFKKSYKEVFSNPDSKKIVNLRKIIAPFILRRTKKEVLTELPDKLESNVVVSLSESQKKLYMSYVDKAKKEMEGFNEKENNRIRILAILTKLRQICNSPALFDGDYDGEVAKIEVLKDILPEIVENGHRVLIFSQFVGTLKEIERELNAQGIEYFYIDGGVKSRERMDISSRFNAGERKAVLISLKAGGTGLNLVGADVVIHYDPWWNIAVEDQASDRAHRIGQKNSVQVIKLITEGTIEEKIIGIQEKKKLLSRNLLEEKDGEKILFEMTDSELMELIGI